MLTEDKAEQTPRLSVIIPHLNEPDNLRRCLEALDLQNIPPGSFEIIVVDNGSRQSPAPLCAQFPGARLEHEAIPGPGPARSKGASVARGELLAFIDADCFADPHWIAQILAYFTDHPEIDFIGGDIGIAQAARQRMTAIEAYEAVFSYRVELFVSRDGFAATGNMAVRAAVFRSVGPFEGIGVHEDRHWGNTALAKGHRLAFVPGAIVRTPACKSFAELCHRMDIHIAHDLADADFNGVGGLKWLVRSVAMAASPLAGIGRIARSPHLKSPHDRWLAMRCLIQIRLYRSARMLDAFFNKRFKAKLATWNR